MRSKNSVNTKEHLLWLWCLYFSFFTLGLIYSFLRTVQIPIWSISIFFLHLFECSRYQTNIWDCCWRVIFFLYFRISYSIFSCFIFSGMIFCVLVISPVIILVSVTKYSISNSYLTLKMLKLFRNSSLKKYSLVKSY